MVLLGAHRECVAVGADNPRQEGRRCDLGVWSRSCAKAVCGRARRRPRTLVKYLLGAHRICVTQAVCSSMSGSFYT